MDVHNIPLKNMTEATMFILLGFTDDFELQVFLFLLFLAIYLFTLVGNFGLVVLVIGDCRLHNPMYYFLSVLSFLDACYSTVVTPKMLVNFLSENKSISFLACATQMLLFVSLGTTECFLLAAMSQPTSVYSGHVTQSIPATHHCFLCWWSCAWCYPHSGHFQSVLLWIQ